MKSSFLLVGLFFVNLSFGQYKISTDGPCTDAKLIQVKGRWLKDQLFDRGTASSGEINKQIEAIHSLVSRIYPYPTGVDAVWHRSIGKSYYGSKLKYFKKTDGDLTYDFLNEPHFLQFSYVAGFFNYFCSDGNFMSPSGETGTWLNITANIGNGQGNRDDTWLINGLPVISLNPVFKTVRGFEIQRSEPGSNSRTVLIHRPGISPYIPVTRRQYLEQCIQVTTQLWNEMIRNLEQSPVRSMEEQEKEKNARLAKFEKDLGKDPKKLKANVDFYLASYKTDQERRDEEVTKTKKIKADEIKKFMDESEKSGQEGLLDSQAAIVVRYYSNPVFATDPERSYRLVTENPAYIRKELPKHMPQFFIVSWTCNDWQPQKVIDRIMETDFPFEQLQEMIDK